MAYDPPPLKSFERFYLDQLTNGCDELKGILSNGEQWIRYYCGYEHDKKEALKVVEEAQNHLSLMQKALTNLQKQLEK